MKTEKTERGTSSPFDHPVGEEVGEEVGGVQGKNPLPSTSREAKKKIKRQRSQGRGEVSQKAMSSGIMGLSVDQRTNPLTVVVYRDYPEALFRNQHLTNFKVEVHYIRYPSTWRQKSDSSQEHPKWSCHGVGKS